MVRWKWLLAALGIMSCCVALGRTHAWPEIVEQEVSTGIWTAAERIELEFPIRGKRGEILYWFTCLGGSQDYLDKVGAGGDIFVKDMTCTLNEIRGRFEMTLLSEGHEAPWHTRGQFHWEDLVGDCGGYPEYGRVRHLRLRGMELTLSATDVEEADGVLRYFRFNVSVRNSREAWSGRVESPGYLHPRGDCANVRKGIEPRMCRRPADGAWEACPQACTLPP